MSNYEIGEGLERFLSRDRNHGSDPHRGMVPARDDFQDLVEGRSSDCRQTRGILILGYGAGGKKSDNISSY